MRTCRACGKKFPVLYPDLWAYRYGMLWYCSWSCLRKDEKEMANMVKNTGRIKKDGTPAKEPGPKRKIETPEGTLAEAMTGMKDAAEEFFGKCDEMGLKVNDGEDSGLFRGTVGAKAAECAVTGPVNYDGLDVTAVRHPDLGEFYFDQKYNSVDWRTPEGEEVSLGPVWWRQMAEELPKILKVLGAWG